MWRACLVALVLPLVLPAPTNAAVRQVPRAFTTIQAALDAAASGDVVVVTPGTYLGSGNRDLDFHGKSVTLRAEGGRPTIDCEGIPGAEHRGFTFSSGETPATVIEGFTIVNGYGGEGAAVYCGNGSSPTFVNCVFRGETATMGGGAVAVRGSSPSFESCLFWGSSAESGGAVLVTDDGAPRFDHCGFSMNVATSGGAIWVRGGRVTFRSCSFFGNAARYRGAGIYSRDGASIELENSLLAFHGVGGATWCDAGASVDASCTDAFGNMGGDWTGGLVGQGSARGNFSQNPRLCLTPGFELFLQQGSPCIERTGCGMVGAYNQGCPPRFAARDDQISPPGPSSPGTSVAREETVSWGTLKRDIERSP